MNFPKTLVFLTIFNLTVATELACAAPATGTPNTAMAQNAAPAANPATVSALPAVPNHPLAASPTAANSSAAAAEDIHDIRGPINIPYGWLWAAYVAGGVALAAAVYGGWRWYRSRAKERAKLPHEIALERLEKARELMIPERAREYSFAVSEIVRRYIEARFHQRAARRTTEEFLHDLLAQADTPLAAHHAQLQDFLHHCDLAKFARWHLSAPEMEGMHESARTFVLETRPQPAAKSSSAAAPVQATQSSSRPEPQLSR